MTEDRVLQRFRKDVADHQMKVLLDQGLHRHLRFMSPGGSAFWFEVVTWPGSLAISGDMGCFVFSRLQDMFEFFHGPRINAYYWSEKLQAGEPREYSSARAEEMVKAHFDEFVEDRDLDEDAAKELWESVEFQVLSLTDSGYQIREAFTDYVAPNDLGFDFSSAWEWDLEDFTYRFLWCLHAILWAIDQYRAATGTVTPPPPERTLTVYSLTPKGTE